MSKVRRPRDPRAQRRGRRLRPVRRLAPARSQENLQKYSECIQKSSGDTSKMQKCADLLTP